MKNIGYAFTSGYTAQGFHSYLPDMASHLDRLIILTGGPGSGKSTFMKQVGLALADRGHQVQFWLSPMDPAYVDGVHLPQLKTAFINGDRIGGGHEGALGSAMYNIDLCQYADQASIENSEEDIRQLTNQIEMILQAVTSDLDKALQTREFLNSRYTRGLDYNKLTERTNRLSDEILGLRPREIHYFSSAITSEGVIHYYEEASRDCDRCYILNGPQDCCKTWIMMRIAEDALDKGYLVKYYHSGLNPSNLEMVVIDGIKVIIADGNIVNSSGRPGQTEIDLFSCFARDSCADDQLEISQAERNYSTLLIQAVEGLIKARKIEEKLSSLFTKAMEFDRIDERREALIREIMEMK